MGNEQSGSEGSSEKGENPFALKQVHKAELTRQIEEIESSFGSRKGLISRLTGFDFERA